MGINVRTSDPTLAKLFGATLYESPEPMAIAPERSPLLNRPLDMKSVEMGLSITREIAASILPQVPDGGTISAPLVFMRSADALRIRESMNCLIVWCEGLAGILQAHGLAK